MKKKILCLMVAALSLAACTQVGKYALKQGINSLQKDLPIVVNEDLTLVGVSMDGDEVVFDYSMSAESAEYVRLVDYENPVVKEAMLKSFRSMAADKDNKEFALFLKLMSTSDCCLRMEFKSGDETVGVCRFDQSEVASMQDPVEENDGDPDEALLQVQVDVYNAMCPMQVDEATLATGASLDAETFRYTYMLDEALIPMETMRMASDVLHDNVLQSLVADGGFDEVGAALARTNRKLVYEYTGDQTGEIMEMTIANTELRDAFLSE